jgi:hypothetical protein
MRIAVDVSPLSVPPTGIGYYIRETTAALAAVAPQHEVVAVALVHPREAACLRERLAPLPPAVVRLVRTLPFAPKWRRRRSSCSPAAAVRSSAPSGSTRASAAACASPSCTT